MSEENVEIVRRVYEAAARRDPATVLALYDTEVELDPSRLQAVGLFDRVYHGHDGLRSFFREWHEAWEGIEYDYDELIDAGERVISVVTRHGRGRASGAEVDWPLALVWTIRKDKVIRVVWFPSRAEALEAAGLSESMSEENVDLVRRLLDMFARRDHEGVFEFYDPDIEWDATAWKSTAVDAGVSGIAGLAGVYRGHEGVRTYWRRWLEAWKDLEFEVEDVLDAGDEVVALIRNQRQVGRHSGIVIEMPPYGLVFTIRGGKVVRWRIYPDQQSALEAAGLRE
jgi:ketosteroid isomerase-like protein